MSVVVTLVGISLLIVVHELGHYALARGLGMRVLRFSLGFGPRLIERKIGETTWQIAAIPLGGFVQIHGMGPSEAEGPPDNARSYRSRPVWQRGLVVCAGPVVNWIFAAAMLAGLAATVGLTRYENETPVLGEVVAGGPADRAGLKPEDRILEINGTPIADWSALAAHIRPHADTPVSIKVARAGSELVIEVVPRRYERGHFGVIDVKPKTERIRVGPIRAIAVGAATAWDYAAEQTRMLWGLVTGKGEGRLAGLPGIVATVSSEAKQGFERLIRVLAWMSVGLSLLNLLPVPALDGSRLAFLGLEAMRRRRLDERIEGMVHTVGFVLLLGLLLYISVRELL